MTGISLPGSRVNHPKGEKDLNGDQSTGDDSWLGLDDGHLDLDVVVVVEWGLNK